MILQYFDARKNHRPVVKHTPTVANKTYVKVLDGGGNRTTNRYVLTNPGEVLNERIQANVSFEIEKGGYETMRNCRRNQVEHGRKNEESMDVMEKASDKRNGKKAINIRKIVFIGLIAVIIVISMNKSTLSRVIDIISFGENNPSKIALAYYLEKNGEQAGAKGVYAMRRRFGCHEEIHIYKEGQLMMKISYANGKIYEMD